MRLTHSIRSAFIRSAMQDVPSVDYRAKLQAALTKAVNAQLPKAVQALVKTHPDFLVTNTIQVGAMQVAVPGVRNYISYDITYRVLPGFPPEVSAEVADIRDAQKAQADAHKELEKKLYSVVNGCTTRKQLVEALPEFEKYLPTVEGSTPNLPAVANVLTDFVKAGWPKNQPKMPKDAQTV